MAKLNLILILIFAAAFSGGAFPVYSQSLEEEKVISPIEEALPETTPEPKYYGYWGSGGAWIDTLTDNNLVFIGSGVPRTSYSSLSAFIAKAGAKGQKSLIMVQGIFWTPNSGSLRSDWASQWNKFYKDVIVPNRDVVLGVYIIDEPLHNARSKFKVSDAAMIANVRAVHNLVKSSDKIKPLVTALTEAYTSVAAGYPVITDWVGINVYSQFADFSLAYNLYQTLIPSLKPHQRLMFTLDGYSSAVYPNEAIENRIMSMLRNYGNYIRSKKAITAAITPFYWDDWTENNLPHYGTRHMPRVAYWHSTFGRFHLTGGPISLPPGIFKSYRDKKWRFYSASNSKYCEFQSSDDFLKLTGSNLSTRSPVMNLLEAYIPIADVFTGPCVQEDASASLEIETFASSTRKISIRWNGGTVGSEYLVNFSYSNPSLSTCLNGKRVKTSEFSLDKIPSDKMGMPVFFAICSTNKGGIISLPKTYTSQSLIPPLPIKSLQYLAAGKDWLKFKPEIDYSKNKGHAPVSEVELRYRATKLNSYLDPHPEVSFATKFPLIKRAKAGDEVTLDKLKAATMYEICVWTRDAEGVYQSEGLNCSLKSTMP